MRIVQDRLCVLTQSRPFCYNLDVSDKYDPNGIIIHSYTATFVDSTCQAFGYTLYQCSSCVDKYTANETALKPHTFPSDTSTTCIECGYVRTLESNTPPATAPTTTPTTTEYSYVYNGSSLSQMTATTNGTTNTLNFAYDANGVPLTVTYNNTTYYYVTNIQGDVVAILDGSGNKVVGYTYDAWGNILETTGTMASALGFYNPLRYRSYVYDQEIGLYYLQSRYYDPEVGRFINADDTTYLGADGTPISYNLFAYCKNNPVIGHDPTGHWDWGVFTDIITTVIAVVSGIRSGLRKGIKTYISTRSAKKAVSTGVKKAVSTVGTINNTVNTVYYNHVSDGETDIEKEPTVSSYTNTYVTRWDRLDYTKQQTGEDTYNFNAWRFQSEYSVHMYGWYATSWAYEGNTPIFSSWANSFVKANVSPHSFDGRPIVDGVAILWGLLGF